ncbi:MAG TPA: major capsid protein P2 [Noviherbaspirillum sp.]|uniref:major capsid protein P2 n=1 Tax=Noviherbaspirillum sp. TaxID=1926288 RepID=UPI002B48AA43|nr:major capsid protein P2 [Noviherbaspirillum sp.]HJV86923.1 major capsid protein P2 [Noviherbaspirillum sp.]
MQVLKNLPFFNVVETGVASLSLPLGMTYERIILELGGTAFTKAMITDLKAKINGKVVWQTTGSRLDALNKFRGLATDANHLVLDFTEIFARDEVGQSLGAIGTAQGVSTFTLEVTITGATAPTLESWSILSGPKNLGVIAKLLSYNVTIGAAGKFPVQLPYGKQGGSIIKRVGFFHANMTDLEVKKNGLVIHDTKKVINEYFQTENKRSPQAGLYVADFIVDNNQSGMLVTADAQSMEWNVTVSAADVITVQVEYLDLLNNL